MLNNIQKEIATSILEKEKLRAKAQVVLNQPTSTITKILSLLLPIGLALLLVDDTAFQAPISVKILLALATSWSLVNTLELWTARRRLDAALILLGLQKRFEE